MMKRRLAGQSAFTAILAMAIGRAHAGVIDGLKNMLSDKIQLKVSVTDEQDRPVPYATLWFMYADKDMPEVSAVDMARLVKRYAADYDIASVGTATPIGAVLTRQVDGQGSYQTEIRENAFQGLSALPVIVGVLKRGYQPLAYAETIPVGATVHMRLRLNKDSAAAFDPRLLELDQVRSEAGNMFPEWTAQERLAQTDRLNVRLIALARAFEQEGKRDEAALVYYNLAYLPSIERVTGADGKVRVVGYTRGYDEKSPIRKAHLTKALELGERIPQLRCRALVDAFVAQGGRVWIDQSKKPLRLQLIADLEDCIKRADGRLFPWVLGFLSDLYSYVGEPVQACAALQRAYRFEPAAYEANRWPNLFEKVTTNARKPPTGLQAFPDFVCKIPS
jgi:hypothetical protein